MFTHILLPTDGSEFANQALTKGAELAKAVGAKITVAVVSPPFAIVAPAEVAIAIPAEEYAQSSARHAESVLAAARAALDGSGLEVHTVHVSDRHPAEGIIECAEKKGCDLIALASHGRRGLSKLLLGSTAQEVVSRAHIPVLIYRA